MVLVKKSATTKDNIEKRTMGMSPYEPPRSAKTLLAKAIANECHANFTSVKVQEYSYYFGGNNFVYEKS